MMISETFKLLRQGKEKVIKKKKTNKNPSLFLRMFKRQKKTIISETTAIQSIRVNNVVKSTTS